MTIAEYMRQHGLDDARFAAQIGKCSSWAVRKWRYGQRVPRPSMQKRIILATKGEVTPADFIEALEIAV